MRPGSPHRRQLISLGCRQANGPSHDGVAGGAADAARPLPRRRCRPPVTHRGTRRRTHPGKPPPARLVTRPPPSPITAPRSPAAHPRAAVRLSGGYCEAFVEDHLFPVAASIWSASRRAMGDFPADAFVRFFEQPRPALADGPSAVAHRHRRLGALRGEADRALPRRGSAWRRR